jgi:stearoyl-CoA desaturase (delta-9 desaturase)
MLTAPQKLRLLFAFNIVSVIGYVFIADDATLVLLGGILYGIFLNVVGNNIGLHRYFSHRSFKIKNDRWLKFFSTVCGLGSQINYCMIHRHHHKFSDTANDPHNPKEIGILKSLFMVYKPVQINPNIVRDLFKDKELKFLHSYYYYIIMVWILLLAFISIEALIIFFSLPALICWISVVAIGIIPHLGDYRSSQTSDNSHNSVIASILSIGEGWHNYHHANPKDYRHGKKWWEFDPAAKLIKWIGIPNENN